MPSRGWPQALGLRAQPAEPEGSILVTDQKHTPNRTSQKNRRRAMRVHGDLPLQIEARDARADARLRDISTAGLCCVFPEPIPEMTLIRIGIEVDGSRHDMEGAVVRCAKDRVSDGYEVAVFFTNLPERTKDSLHNYVEGREREGATT